MKKTVFYREIEKNPEKLRIFRDGIKNGLIKPFDQEILTRLRKVYYACYNGVILIYMDDTNEKTIGNKVETLTLALRDEPYYIVNGETDSIRNTPFEEYGVEPLEINSWVELQIGSKIWIYDLYSMLMFDRRIYEKLEHPTRTSIVPRDAIEKHPYVDYRSDFTRPHDKWLFVQLLPKLEARLNYLPYGELLQSEITRYKQEIDYEEALLDYQYEQRETKRIYKNTI